MDVKGIIFIDGVTEYRFELVLCPLSMNLWGAGLLDLLSSKFPILYGHVKTDLEEAIVFADELDRLLRVQSALDVFPREVSQGTPFLALSSFVSLSLPSFVNAPFDGVLRHVEFVPFYRIIAVSDELNADVVLAKLYRARYSRRGQRLTLPNKPFLDTIIPLLDGRLHVSGYPGSYNRFSLVAAQNFNLGVPSSMASVDYWPVWVGAMPAPDWHFAGQHSDYSIVMLGNDRDGYHMEFQDSGYDRMSGVSLDYPAVIPEPFGRVESYGYLGLEGLSPDLDGVNPCVVDFPGATAYFVPVKPDRVSLSPVADIALILGLFLRPISGAIQEDDMVIGQYVLYSLSVSSMPGSLLVCDGQEILRSSPYGELLVGDGMPYGIGNGSTTVNIPDVGVLPLQGVAVDSDLGVVVGSDQTTLLVDHLPSHDHAISAGYNAGGSAVFSTAAGYVDGGYSVMRTESCGGGSPVDVRQAHFGVYVCVYVGE